MISIPPTIAVEMSEHALAWYPSECCGLAFAKIADVKEDGSCVVSRVACMNNEQDKYHERLPEDFPRTSRDAFKLNERQVMRMAEEAADNGERLVAYFHSHIDCGAYFSQEDILMAAPFGEPNEPEMWHVVIDGQPDGVHGAKAYRWDNTTFVEFAIDFPALLKS